MRKEKLEELHSYIEELKVKEMKEVEVNGKGFLSSKRYVCELANGKTIVRERIIKNGQDGSAAIIVPVTKEGNVLLVVQPRVFCASTIGVEFPAGYIEAGEDPKNNPIEYILECIKTIYSVHHKNGDIRRVNVNIAATTVENYRKLKDAGIGTYILFQETYHKDSYLKLHPTGPKHDYAYHTEAMDRAMEGGIDDVGLGVLFGLELYKYEFAGLIMHAEHLEAVHGVGPHTISVPRVKKADDIDPEAFDNSISDETFAKITACIRLAVPYTGMIISTRETEETRTKLLRLGVSQVSGGSRTSVGGYTQEERPHDTEQFDVSDQRTLDDVVAWLMENGHIPSFCTACYREGRTGDRFMTLCKNGQILNCCHPNALMTLTEYLVDYASDRTKEIGFDMVEKELERIPKEKVRQIAKDNIDDIKNSNRRDFRF